MAVWRATKTLEAMDAAICADGGNSFRRLQGTVLPHMLDAYREDDDAYRTHLGASVIGGKCIRAIWYGFRWAAKKKPSGKKRETAAQGESRMRRLWNRGHLEEGRFIALLLMIGVMVYQQDAEGKQYKISAFGGHFGGSGDGILMGVPDVPEGVPCVGEFKTHSTKSFTELVEFGVKEAKPEHYVQMQEYMHHFGILYTLYLAVDKDTDELYAEIVVYDRVVADQFLDRAKAIIFSDTIPRRIAGGNPAYHVCKYMCDDNLVCYSTVPPDRNCRTCENVRFVEDGTVRCLLREIFPGDDGILDKEAQLAGCGDYRTDKRF